MKLRFLDRYFAFYPSTNGTNLNKGMLRNLIAKKLVRQSSYEGMTSTPWALVSLDGTDG